MYNGIGLSTVRGSATSGHVTKNLSHVQPEFFRNKLDMNSGKLNNQATPKLRTGNANAEVLDHNRKRNIEAKIFAFEEELAEKGFTDDEISEKSAQLRKQLELMSRNGDIAQESSKMDSHAIAVKKLAEINKLKSAFGIADDFVEGEAFDPQLQEQRKLARIAEKESKIEEEKKRRLEAESRRVEREERARRTFRDKPVDNLSGSERRTGAISNVDDRNRRVHAPQDELSSSSRGDYRGERSNAGGDRSSHYRDHYTDEYHR